MATLHFHLMPHEEQNATRFVDHNEISAVSYPNLPLGGICSVMPLEPLPRLKLLLQQEHSTTIITAKSPSVPKEDIPLQITVSIKVKWNINFKITSISTLTSQKYLLFVEDS